MLRFAAAAAPNMMRRGCYAFAPVFGHDFLSMYALRLIIDCRSAPNMMLPRWYDAVSPPPIFTQTIRLQHALLPRARSALFDTAQQRFCLYALLIYAVILMRLCCARRRSRAACAPRDVKRAPARMSACRSSPCHYFADITLPLFYAAYDRCAHDAHACRASLDIISIRLRY